MNSKRQKTATKVKNEPEGREEESSILASIGSSLTNQSTYETQVLRDATLSSQQTPLLSGIGFPNLESLAPNGGSNDKVSNPDIAHMVTIFNKVTNQLDDIETSSSSYSIMEHKSTNILRMKKQILLSYFASFTNLQREDINFDPSYETKMELKRKDLLRKNANSHSHSNPSSENKRKEGNRPKAFRKHDNNGSNSNNRIRVGQMDTKRLEEIKQNNSSFIEDPRECEFMNDNDDNTIDILSKSKNASFGKQAIESQQKSRMNSARGNTTKNKKFSMMGLKRKLVQDQGEEWIDPELLYQKRMERLKRRRERRNGGTTLKGIENANETSIPIESLNDFGNNLDNKERGKKRRKNEIKKKQLKRNSSKRKIRSPIDKSNDAIAQITDSKDIKDSTKVVSCPICNNESIPVPVEFANDIDAFLSKHMHNCTNNLDGKRVSLRSSRRTNLRSIRQVNYKEDMNEGDHANDNDHISIESSTCHDDVSVDINYVNDSDIGDTEGSDSEDDTTHNSRQKPPTESSDFEHFKPTAVDDYDEEDYEDRVDDWIMNGIENMKKMSEQDLDEDKPGAVTYPGGLHVPAWINDRLFGYQRTALRWMWELNMQGAGGIVGDEMGLGKTVQVCSFLGSLASSRKMRSVLIIAPATMLMHWMNELAIWAPGLRRILIHKSGEKDINTNRGVSSYMLRKLDKWLNISRAERLYEPIDERDLLENDPNSFVGTGLAFLTTFESIRRSPEAWINYDWSYVIMDEGQKIRNPDADVTIACKRLRTTNRLLLSGTPIQNDLRELWSLFDFVFPGRLGILPTFLAEFADPIRRGGYSNASPMQVQLAYRCALVLRDLINPYLLRRQKKDIKEVSRMPGKTEQVLFCKLSKRQRRMYESYIQSDEVQHILRNRGTTHTFRPIITLRKICNHPHLVVGSFPGSYESFLKNGSVDKSSFEDYSSDDDSLLDELADEESLVESSGKMEVLAKILPLWKKQGHRVLIFSQWKKTLDIIQKLINMMGYNFGRMDGNTNVASRQKLVDKFNSDDSLFGMLLTTKTGGVGLNLIGANRVILFDPDWNPQSDAQARERAWRFGQKNPVTVYRLITAGTIEEKIYQRQIFKTAITNQILQDPRQRRMFSQKDLRDLFTLKPDCSYSSTEDGVTETGELTKGRGVINIDDVNESDEIDDDAKDNKNTLDEVLKSKGLAGIFDHDVVDKPFAKKSLTAQEIEQQAKKAASRAAKILAESSHQISAFVPTWTGTDETTPQRFGGVTNTFFSNRIISNSNSNKTSYDEGFGGAQSAGVGLSTASDIASSSHLLAGFGHRRKEIATGGASGSSNGKDKDNVELLKRIKEFIESYCSKVGRGPATNELLKEFQGEKVDAAVFKSLLKAIARFSQGQWVLK